MGFVTSVALASTCVGLFLGVSHASARDVTVPWISVGAQATALAWDASDNLVLASTSQFSYPDNDSLVAIDATTWTIVKSVFVGNGPRQIAISQDDSVAYVVSGADVREYSLPDLTWLNDVFVGYIPLDIAVMPGNPDVLAVATDQVLPGLGGGVTIYDHGVPRPSSALVNMSGVHGITFGAAPTDLYAAPSGGGDFVRLKVDASGASVIDSTANMLIDGEKVTFVGGRVYGDRGTIIDPSVPTSVGQIAADGSQTIVYDPAYDRAYAISYFNTPSGLTQRLEQWKLSIVARLDPPLSLGLTSSIATTMISLGDGYLAAASKVTSDLPGRTNGDVLLLQPALFDGSLGEYTPLTPTRILDTRDGTGRGGVVGPVPPGGTINVQITGRGGVRASGVDAVVLNATVTNTTAPGFLTIWPSGVERPLISSVNFIAGQTVPNLVTVALGYDGALNVFNSFGSTDVVFDVAGFYSSPDGPHGQRFHPISPSRLFDTRDGTGGVRPALGQGEELSFRVTGTNDVPVTGVTAVVMNVTITRPTAPGFLTVYPADVSRPVVSNLNFTPGLTVPNLVIVRVPSSGLVNFFNSAGKTDVLADVVGYFDNDTSTQSGRLFTFIPFRALDTRVDSPFPGDGKMWPQSDMWIGDPQDPASAYVLNVTVTEPDTAGYLTVYPRGELTTPPFASNLNFVAGQTVANAVMVGTGPYLGFHNAQGFTHMVVDVFGFYT